MRNPYWEAAKWTFAVVGGGAVAGSLVVGSYKVTRRYAGRLLDKLDEFIDSKSEENTDANQS